MILDASILAAIKNYFDKKFHDGTGGFKEGEKEPAVERVKTACVAHGYNVMIVPGLITVYLENGSVWFDQDNQATGTFITKETKNPWRVMDEGRAVKKYEFWADRLDKPSQFDDLY